MNKEGPVYPEHGQCWLWVGSFFTGKPYGQFSVKDETVRAHVFSWKLHYGEIAEDLCVLHHCDIPACVNPTHLFLGTILDNSEDKVAKGRQARGETQGSAKLTEEIVREIRALYRWHHPIYGTTGLSRLLGIPQPTIAKIISRKSWKHVE